MSNDDEKDRDNWVRLTLRLPPKLHSELVAQAGVLSLNAVIVQKLEQYEKIEEQLRIARDATKEYISKFTRAETRLWDVEDELKERKFAEALKNSEVSIQFLRDLVDQLVSERLREAMEVKSKST